MAAMKAASAGSTDPLASLQQMSSQAQRHQHQHQQQSGGNWDQGYHPTHAPSSYNGTDLEPVPLPASYSSVNPGNSLMPDQVLSAALENDELTLEEYMESMKEYKEFLEPPKQQDRSKALEEYQDQTWVKSFHSVESSTHKTDDSGGTTSIMSSNYGMDLPSRDKKKRSADGHHGLRSQYHHMGQSTRTALSGTTQKSTFSARSAATSKSGLTHMSGLSALSEKSKRSTKSQTSMMSGVSGVSMFSDFTGGSRASKMSAARGLTSNLSMMSDITDLSETLNQMDLQTAASSKS